MIRALATLSSVIRLPLRLAGQLAVTACVVMAAAAAAGETGNAPAQLSLAWPLRADQSQGERPALDPRLIALERLSSRDPREALRLLDALAGETLSERDRVHAGAIRASALATQYELPAALALAESLLAQSRALDEPRIEAALLGVRALAMVDQRRCGEAMPAANEGVVAADRGGDLEARVSNRTLLALVAAACGDHQRAYGAIEEAEPMARASASPALAGHVSDATARLAREIGDLPTALRAYGEAESAFAADGDRLSEGDAARNHAATLVQMNRHVQAIAPARRAIAIFESIDDRFGKLAAQGVLARALAATGMIDEALRLHRQVLQQTRAHEGSLALADQLIVRSELLTRAGRALEALPDIEEAARLLDGGEEIPVQIDFHQRRADVYAQLGRYREAHAALQAMLAVKAGYDEQRLSRQLAAQRGRLESRRLAADLERAQRESQQQRQALEAAARGARVQTLLVLLALAATVLACYALARSIRRNRRTTRLAHTDELTGVQNRRRIDQLGTRLLQQYRQQRQPLAVLLFDIDHFKAINDDFGHQIGDRALRAVAGELKRQLRQGDELGRYGGEEFVAVLPGAGLPRALAIAERLRQAVGALPPSAMGTDRAVTISIGVAALQDETDFATLVTRADRGLYAAKAAGRNRVLADRDHATAQADVAATPTGVAAPQPAPLPQAE